MDKLEALKHYFGHSSFRPGQEPLVDGLIAGRDVLGVMPTGAGKSICYQVPALVREGTAIVISPLISLMQDQVNQLKAAGIPAAYLNSSLTPAQQDKAMQLALTGQYRVIYAAPQRLSAPGFRRLCAAMPISLVAVDEAHCISQWGQDFRPDYLRITDFLNNLPGRPPVGAFTATATDQVKRDIIRALHLDHPVTTQTGFDRPNLYFETQQIRPRYRPAMLLEFLRGRQDQSGIIYCTSRKDTESVSLLLRRHGFAAEHYHAGMSDDDRRRVQQDFRFDRLRVIAATNAFGMGIDKSNVNYVVHYSLPASMEAYYQEAGRAGRDGAPADCLLMFSPGDLSTQRWLITHSENQNPDLTEQDIRTLQRRDLNRLSKLGSWAEGKVCLRAGIRRYFGETAPDTCDACSVCCGSRFGFSEQTGQAAPTARPSTKAPAPDWDQALFARLKDVRTRLSNQAQLPAYIICSDKTLQSMAAIKPHTPEDMLKVYGMGNMKVASYGEDFLQVINAYDPPIVSPGPAPQKPARAHRQWQPQETAMLIQGFRSGMSEALLSQRLQRPEDELRAYMADLMEAGSRAAVQPPADFPMSGIDDGIADDWLPPEDDWLLEPPEEWM